MEPQKIKKSVKLRNLAFRAMNREYLSIIRVLEFQAKRGAIEIVHISKNEIHPTLIEMLKCEDINVEKIERSKKFENFAYKISW